MAAQVISLSSSSSQSNNGLETANVTFKILSRVKVISSPNLNDKFPHRVDVEILNDPKELTDETKKILQKIGELGKSILNKIDFQDK